MCIRDRGYAALLFGTLLGAEEVLCFAPQTVLDLDILADMGDHRWDWRLGRQTAAGAVDVDKMTRLGEARNAADALEIESAAAHAAFAREGAILPAMIETLHDARSRATHQRNEPLSRAIKILMNSFYGVLGTSACRFFNPALANSITGMGLSLIHI